MMNDQQLVTILRAKYDKDSTRCHECLHAKHTVPSDLRNLPLSKCFHKKNYGKRASATSHQFRHIYNTKAEMVLNTLLAHSGMVEVDVEIPKFRFLFPSLPSSNVEVSLDIVFV
ncbi:hypothetical protein AMECASPLE_031689 [Ameca splendens]|uniref:Uncharacterized protein n=1 Tax=Ameca splendens TaxID=208324 RepID=A0ABV0Y6A1_9TELE